MPKIDLSSLNQEQKKAVVTVDKPVLLLAGAGSGKTRVITYRIAYLIGNKGIAPNRILALTFTNKAAKEMRGRARSLLTGTARGLAIFTFHSLCVRFLREFIHLLGYHKDFVIFDTTSQLSTLKTIFEDEGIDTQTFNIKATHSQIMKAKGDGHGPDYFLQQRNEPFSQVTGKIFQEYNKTLKGCNALDFEDILYLTIDLFKRFPQETESLQKLYEYIMVDEYQDTNKIQADIVYRLAFCNHNVMAVGDDSQSIYAFRGANFKNIMTFPDIFPDTKIVRLEENYRSVQPILDFTNVLIDKAKEKYTKYLFTRRTGGSTPKLVEAGSENDQSRFIVEKIMELYRDGIPFQEIAVLFRAGFHSFDLEIELNREGIAFIKYGGFKFMESAHIKDFLAHLRVLLNPNDRISWHRILLLLNKVGPRTADKIFRAIVNEKAGSTGLLTIAPKAGWARGFERLKGLFSTLDSQPMPILEMGETIFAYYEEILKEKYDDHPKRIRDLEHLLTIMPRYNDLEPFLTDMALEPPNASADANLSIDDTGEDRLVLSTVHSAKGLEWHTVFVIWALDGRFPSLRAMDSEEELEEERRLMYVAATRAREHLFFTYPGQVYDRGSGMMFSEPSRFLDDMPFEILERTTADSW